jgi:pilus assembly protein CpaC
MSRMTNLIRLTAGAFLGAATLAMSTPAPAETYRTVPATHRVVYVPRDKSVAFHVNQPPSRIVVSQPDTASVRATGGTSFYIQGKELGDTNLLIYGPSGRLSEILDVRVGYDSQGLQQDLAALFPDENIRVRSLGAGLLLSGHVSNTGVANRAKALAEKFAPQAITSQMTVAVPQEVVLEVRVLEASRSLMRDMGVTTNIQNGSFQFATGTTLLGADVPKGILALTGGFGHTSVDLQLAALEAKGVVRTLARPNLVALSGEKASFLAGGEFPYPVPQTSGTGTTTITLEFRKYGVKLDFTPNVQDNGLIRLEVEPEVSKLDPTNSIKISGFVVPGLITRNTHTTVELRNGASLAIGGLYQRDYENDVRQLPVLGDIPIFSSLFRSARWRRAETELIIIVTPRLVEASDFDKAKATTSMPGEEPRERDLLLNGKALDRPIASESEALER